MLRFIGGRPIVGYYVDFDVRMLDKYVLRYIEAKLPNRRIEVSEIYYALKYGGAPPGRCSISGSSRSCRTWAFPVSGNTMPSTMP